MPVPSGVTKADDRTGNSNKVNSANWQEEVMLQKKLTSLNRTEKSVVHKIVMDQKVLYKQFQTKLLRSRIFYARLMGDKETEQELRNKTSHGLNTDSHSPDDQCAFLKKLEHRPFSTGNGNNNMLPPSKFTRHTFKTRENHNEGIGRIRSKSVCETLSNSPVFPNTLDNTTTAPVASNNRPASSTGICLENEYSVMSNGKTTKILQNVDKKTNDGIYLEHQRPRMKSRLSFGDLRPHTCAVPFRERSDRSPRRSSTGMATGRRRFVDDEKVTNKNTKVHRMETKLTIEKSMDYSSRVNTFIKSLDPLANGVSDEVSDYYLRRLEGSVENRANRKNVFIPGTPDDEYRRLLGKADVRSLTLGKLNLNFEDADDEDSVLTRTYTTSNDLAT